MKILILPIRLLQFWYPESLVVFLRFWKNILTLLEEDLAVSLMLKLLFVPLFHDTSIVGRILSFFFRLSRILVGIAGYLIFSAGLFIVALGWFGLPILILILPEPFLTPAKLLVFSGVVLFSHHILAHPVKKLWQIKSKDQVWQCSKVKPNQIKIAELLKTAEVKNLLLYLELTPENLLELSADPPIDLVVEKVWELVKKLMIDYLGPEHFLVGILSSYYLIDNFLAKYNLKLNDFYQALSYLKLKSDSWRMVLPWDDDFSVRHLKGVNRGWLSAPTPKLDVVSRDITLEASRRQLTEFVGRAEVVDQVVRILSTEKGRNVLIVGESGAGKTSLVEHLAQWIVSGDAPASLATKRLVGLKLPELLSGIKTEGDLAEKIKDIFEEIKFLGNIVLFIDEIQDLGLGEAGSQLNLFSLLLPYLESLDFQFVAATEPATYYQILQKNSALARLFTRVNLPPASVSDTLEIIKHRSVDKERYQKIKTSCLAQQAVAELTERYIHERVLPDSAIQTYFMAVEKARGGWIKKALVEEVIQNLVNIPIGQTGEGNKKVLLGLENELRKKVVGQEEALQKISQTLRRAAVEMRDINRPVGSFLFVGPTGVGKTEVSKALSESYFQDKGQFLQFDMSEYQSEDGIARLIGKDNEAGSLTEKIKLNPYSLVLLDEFEKASPLVLTLFLQVLEEGRLTDGIGKTVDFSNTIIIATSNAGSITLAKLLQQKTPWPEIQNAIQEELLQVFKPELINRFDNIVIFRPLSPLDLQKIVRIKLAALQKQLKEKGFLIDFDDGLVGELAKRGFDPVLGARPLRRLIQDTLESQLSKLILENKLIKGQQFEAGVDLLSS